FNAQLPGVTSKTFAIGMAPLWKPAEGVTARIFADYWNQTASKTQPRIYIGGIQQPPRIDRKFFGQSWTDDHYIGRTFGAVVHVADFSHWILSAGVFHSEFQSPLQYADLFV